MAGSIIPRGERRWLVRWYEGIGEDGKRVYRSQTVRGKKKEAETLLSEKVVALDQGEITCDSKMRLNQYLDKWLKEGAPLHLRLRTVLDYTDMLKRHVRPQLGMKRLDRLTVLDVQGMVRQMQDQGLLPATIHRCHAILSRALKQAVKWGLVRKNAATGVVLPKLGKREMLALEPEQAGRFREAIGGTPHEAFFLLLLGTGLRPSEALALRWEDLDLDTRTVKVERTLPRWRRRDPIRFEATKTEWSERTVPLPQVVAVALRSHRAQQAEERLAAGADYADHGLVFATVFGLPLSEPNLVRRHFKPALKRAGLAKELRLYDLRHSYASLAMAAGVNVKVVSERMGHKSVAITLDTYSHVLKSVATEADAKIEAAIFGGG